MFDWGLDITIRAALAPSGGDIPTPGQLGQAGILADPLGDSLIAGWLCRSWSIRVFTRVCHDLKRRTIPCIPLGSGSPADLIAAVFRQAYFLTGSSIQSVKRYTNLKIESLFFNGSVLGLFLDCIYFKILSSLFSIY